MSPFRRNVIVGVTVLVGIVVLAWMTIKFGGGPAQFFVERGYPVEFTVDRADGLSEGSLVFYRGVGVGKVTAIHRQDDNKAVKISAEIDKGSPLPSNVQGTIKYQSLLGSAAALHLALLDPEPKGELKEGAKLTAVWVGLDVLPAGFKNLADDLQKTSQAFRDSKLIENMNAAVLKATQTIDNLNSFVGDDKVKTDLKTAVANFKDTTESAKKAAASIETFSSNADQLTKQMSGRLEQLSKLLDNFNSISTKIDQGQGTAGKLVNDPKLYESLVDTSRELNATVSDLKRLVEQWEQDGVSLKLK